MQQNKLKTDRQRKNDDGVVMSDLINIGLSRTTIVVIKT